TKSPVCVTTEKMIVLGLTTRREIAIFDPILLFFYLIRSANILRKNKIVLIISTVPKINNAIAGFILSKLFRVPHIIDVRDFWESTLFSYPLNNIVPRTLTLLLIKLVSFLYRQANSIITVNKTLKNMLHRRGIPSNKIYVIPNGADTSTFRPCKDQNCVKKTRRKYGLSPSKIIFVYGGALTIDYKFDALLKGIKRLKHDSRANKKIMLLLVGRPTLLVRTETILDYVKKLKLEHIVQIKGPLPEDKLAELLRCCNVGLIPLRDDKILIHVITAKIFAYLASGLPVLASGPSNGELENFIKQYGVGYFIGKCTAENFAEGLRKFIQEKKKTSEMGLRGRIIVKKFFDRYALAHKLIQIMQELLKM
ncbi:MAG: glycosyltransferase family 4 protein, partial [Candidatus Hodarchaeota archaeon]